MNIDSPKINVAAPADKVYDFLSQADNFQKLMPEGVEKFTTGKEDGKQWFAFIVKGMPEIKLVEGDKLAVSSISYTGSASSKAAIKLNLSIEPVAGGNSELSACLLAEVNPFVRMMIEKPLKNFIGELLTRVEKAI